ncbi:MAG: hypothetical protein AAFN30_08015 [Actinomycetota bacterium]
MVDDEPDREVTVDGAVGVGGIGGLTVPTIADPLLQVLPIPDAPGRRELVVSYLLTWTEADTRPDGEAVARAVVRSRDLHDGPVRPEPFEVVIEEPESADGEGVWRRQLRLEVGRAQLDVLRDWWRTGHGGEIEAIAEFADHLVAEITIWLDGAVVASATTPVVTGSWGALGED